MHYTSESIPKEDRDQFIRDNAIPLVAARDRKIERLRRELRKMNERVKSLRAELRKAKS